MIIIDANEMIAGRIAAFAAKKALLGETVNIINSENALITGSKSDIIKRFKWKLDELGTYKGPLIDRRPERMLKRFIRGMLPYKKSRGREALKRIKCHLGTPDEFKEKEVVIVPKASVAKVPNLKYMKIKELSKILGAKI